MESGEGRLHEGPKLQAAVCQAQLGSLLKLEVI